MNLSAYMQAASGMLECVQIICSSKRNRHRCNIEGEHLKAELSFPRFAELCSFVDDISCAMVVNVKHLVRLGAVKNVRLVTVRVEDVVACHSNLFKGTVPPHQRNESRRDGSKYHSHHIDELLGEENFSPLLNKLWNHNTTSMVWYSLVQHAQ
jgi:hypothetical protein